MRNGLFPIFTKGRVLKKESIEYLRDFPYDLAALARESFSDGILFGFSVGSSDDGKRIVVSKGALKYQGDIIVVPEGAVAVQEYGELLYLRLAVGDARETEDYRTRNMEQKLDRQGAGAGNGAGNEIELGRFCLNSGAVLRCEYHSFGDLRTPENTLDITRVYYAGRMAPTLHPRALREYAQALLAASHDPAEIAFALMCMNAGVVHKGSIQWHIAKKTERPYEEYTLPALYDKLVELLPQHGPMGRRERQRGRGPSIV